MDKFQSVAAMFRHRVRSTPDRESFSWPEGGTWRQETWAQTGATAYRIAAGLRALGVQDEDRVAILSGTRVHWLWSDLGIMCAGAACTTIYPSTPPDDCQYILADSGSVVCIAENDAQVAKLVDKRAELPGVRAVVNVDGAGGHDGWVLSWSDLLARGDRWQAENPGGLDAIIERITPAKLATLIYTSGTTGRPKGVELLNDCWLYTGEALEQEKILGPDDKQFLWLPLSHSFGKVLETIVVALGIPTAVDGEITRIVDNLAVVRPTFMGAAPRIFEKVHNKVVNGAREAGGAKWAIFRWAVQVGRRVGKLRQEGREPGGLLALQHRVADKLVFSKLRARFGGRVRFFISGAAPLNREIAEFFHAAGLLILEGYGLTETSAASFVNRPETNRFGTVGPPLPGTEVRVAPDGEVLIKSRGVMRGYHNLPDATAEAIEDGWMHTGDIGELTPGGHLRITDRKKDLIKTSGGKYVAPQAIEGAFKAACPLVSQIVVHGNNRNFCTALLTMDPDAIKSWAAANGLGDLSYAALAVHPQVRAEFQRYVDQVNGNLARYETIKHFALLPADFTVESGELTPSLKVKRKTVESKYREVLDGFYAGATEQV